MSPKTTMTVCLSKEAIELALIQGYANLHTLGDFISQSILDYHERQNRKAAFMSSLKEWRQSVDEVEQLLHSGWDNPEF